MSRPGFDRRDLLAIAVGGVLGAAVRWWITDLGIDAATDGGWFAYAPNTSPTASSLPGAGFPTTTLVVNLIGTFVLGGVLTLRAGAPTRRRLWLGLGGGFCGSLTTFSAFANDIALRLADFPTTHAVTVGSNIVGFEPAGEVLTLSSGTHPRTEALVYLLVSLGAGAAAFVAGRRSARRLSGPTP